MNRTPNYHAWDEVIDLPDTGSPAEKINFILRCGTLAANIHNTQPWKFTVVNDKIIVSISLLDKLPLADPTGRNICISLGTCLANIISAAAALKLTAQIIDIREDKQTVEVTVQLLNTAASPELADLFTSIPVRYSNKMEYNSKSVEETVIKQLQTIHTQRANVFLLQDTDRIADIAQLMENTTSNFSKIPGFNTELVQWLKDTNTSDFDGMPGFVVGLTQAGSIKLKQEMVDDSTTLAKLGKIDGKVIRSSPVIGLILIKQEDVMHWIDAGIIYQRLALSATQLGLSITPMQALIEYSPSFNQLKQIINIDSPAAMFFRLGYADNTPYHTPRRTLDSFMNGAQITND